jgi:hypothetical protein
MKKIFLAVAATAALAAAMPAAAQSYGHGRNDNGRDQYSQRQYQAPAYQAASRQSEWNRGTRREWVQANRIDARQEQIARRIDQAVYRGALTRYEGRTLTVKLRNIEQLEQRYKRSNRDLSRAEVRALTTRLDQLNFVVTQKIRS